MRFLRFYVQYDQVCLCLRQVGITFFILVKGFLYHWFCTTRTNPSVRWEREGVEQKGLVKDCYDSELYSTSKLTLVHHSAKGKYRISAANLAALGDTAGDSFWNIRFIFFYEWSWTYGVWRRSGQNCKSLWNHLMFWVFLFRYPQIWSLTDFPSSNIVTYLWQQLHIQLVSRDVTYHSEKIPECKDEPKS